MIHLHVHSHYSLLTATPSVTDLVTRAVRDGLPALALTDDNALYGAVAFRQACDQAGKKEVPPLPATGSRTVGAGARSWWRGWGRGTYFATLGR
jgi:DNA polymerase III alpha subunit